MPAASTSVSYTHLDVYKRQNKHFIKYMRQANLFMMSAAMLLAACGGTKDAGKTDQVLIEKSNIKIRCV